MLKFIKHTAIFIAFSSCITQKKCNEKFPPTTYDSIQIRDSIICVKDTIYQPYQDVTFIDDSPCPPQVQYHKEINKGGLTGIVDISAGKIHFTCKQDSLQYIVNRLSHQIMTIKSRREIVKEIEYKTYWYDTPCRWWTILSILLILLLIIYKLYKKIPWA